MHKMQKQLIRIVLGLLAMCILGPISLDLKGYVPITLQSLIIVLVPMILGWRHGVIVIGSYLLLGAFGLPVFADYSSGWEVFTDPTVGFIFGFLPSGFFAGYFSERVKVQYGRFFLVFLVAHLILLLCGSIGLLLFGIGLHDLWQTIVFLFPGLMIKSFFGAFVVLAVKMKSA